MEEIKKFIREHFRTGKPFSMDKTLRKFDVKRHTLKKLRNEVLREPEFKNLVKDLEEMKGRDLEQRMRRRFILKKVLDSPDEIKMHKGSAINHFMNIFDGEYHRSVLLRDLNHLTENYPKFKEELERKRITNPRERQDHIRGLFRRKASFDPYILAAFHNTHRSVIEKDVHKVIDEDNLWDDLDRLERYDSQIIQRYVKKQRIKELVESNPEIKGSKRKYILDKLNLEPSVFHDYINELLENPRFKKKWKDFYTTPAKDRQEKIIRLIEKEKLSPKEIQERLKIYGPTFRTDKEEIISRYPDKAKLFEEKVKSRPLLIKEENMRKLRKHVLASDIENHPAIGKLLEDYYKDYLGVRSINSVYKYVKELSEKDAKFKKVYEKLKEKTLEERAKKPPGRKPKAMPEKEMVKRFADFMKKHGDVTLIKLNEHGEDELAEEIVDLFNRKKGSMKVFNQRVKKARELIDEKPEHIQKKVEAHSPKTKKAVKRKKDSEKPKEKKVSVWQQKLVEQRSNKITYKIKEFITKHKTITLKKLKEKDPELYKEYEALATVKGAPSLEIMIQKAEYYIEREKKLRKAKEQRQKIIKKQLPKDVLQKIRFLKKKPLEHVMGIGKYKVSMIEAQNIPTEKILEFLDINNEFKQNLFKDPELLARILMSHPSIYKKYPQETEKCLEKGEVKKREEWSEESIPSGKYTWAYLNNDMKAKELSDAIKNFLDGTATLEQEEIIDAYKSTDIAQVTKFIKLVKPFEKTKKKRQEEVDELD